jgi:hypothetical protein
MVVMNWRRTGRDGGGGDGIAAGKQLVVLREEQEKKCRILELVCNIELKP